MKIDGKEGRKVVKQALTKEKTIVTNLATLWALGLLLLSLSAGWFNLTNQVNNLEQDNDILRADIVSNEERIKVVTEEAQKVEVTIAEINTRLTSIDATLLEIKAGL